MSPFLKGPIVSLPGNPRVGIQTSTGGRLLPRTRYLRRVWDAHHLVGPRGLDRDSKRSPLQEIKEKIIRDCTTPITLSLDTPSPCALSPRALSPNGLKNINQAIRMEFFYWKSIKNGISTIIHLGDRSCSITFYYNYFFPLAHQDQEYRD